jgi:hypothetical protein
MAIPAYLTASDGTDSSAWVANIHVTPFNIGLGAVVVSGAPTYTVQHTFDNVLPATGNFDASTVTWFDHASMAGVIAVNRDGNYAFPVRAIRIRVTAGTGTVRLAVIQAGIKQ